MPTKPLVLIVDDDPQIHSVLADLLGGDYQFVAAADVDHAVDLLRRGVVSIVLLNLRAHEVSGFDVLVRIKTTDPRVETITMSSNVDAESVVQAMKLGASDFIPKPLDAEVLRAKLRRAQHRLADGPRVLLVGTNVHTLAPLEALLGTRVRTRAMSPTRAASHDVHGRGPALVILDIVDSVRDTCAYVTLRQRFAQSFLLLILDSASLVRRAPELASVPAEGLLLRPYQLSDMLDRVATFLAAAGEPRVSWASLRPHVLKAIEYLGARYVETCDVTDLASWVGISPSRLAHVFRDAMQETMRDYINRIRIAAARYLLVERNLTVDEVAQEVGFCEASHLSRVFVSCEGVRPGRYREENAAKSHRMA